MTLAINRPDILLILDSDKNIFNTKLFLSNIINHGERCTMTN